MRNLAKWLVRTILSKQTQGKYILMCNQSKMLKIIPIYLGAGLLSSNLTDIFAGSHSKTWNSFLPCSGPNSG